MAICLHSGGGSVSSATVAGGARKKQKTASSMGGCSISEEDGDGDTFYDATSHDTVVTEGMCSIDPSTGIAEAESEEANREIEDLQDTLNDLAGKLAQKEEELRKAKARISRQNLQVMGAQNAQKAASSKTPPSELKVKDIKWKDDTHSVHFYSRDDRTKKQTDV
jgi:hypothetical protein